MQSASRIEDKAAPDTEPRNLSNNLSFRMAEDGKKEQLCPEEGK
jgi:hypothetical protein